MVFDQIQTRKRLSVKQRVAAFCVLRLASISEIKRLCGALKKAAQTYRKGTPPSQCPAANLAHTSGTPHTAPEPFFDGYTPRKSGVLPYAAHIGTLREPRENRASERTQRRELHSKPPIVSARPARCAPERHARSSCLVGGKGQIWRLSLSAPVLPFCAFCGSFCPFCAFCSHAGHFCVLLV